MSKLNALIKQPPIRNHEGARAVRIPVAAQLRRSVMSCLLWESEFYEDGEEIAARIVRLASEAPLPYVSALAIELREQGNLRHVPLLLLSVLAKRSKELKVSANGAIDPALIGVTIERVIQRPDELTEFLAIHAKLHCVDKLAGAVPGGLKKIISAQMKLGLARAFRKFNEYSLAKYNRDSAIKLADVLKLCHAKPSDEAQAALWKRVLDGKLETPDTWETQLSAGANKRETFERLIREGKLGYFALLRNLRNMASAGCDVDLVKQAIIERKNGAQRILPFRYIAAARAAPQFEPALDQALSEAIAEMPILEGKTAVLVDISPSMNVVLSAKSDLRRVDAAAALAAIWPGDVRMFSFSSELVEVPARRGMAGVDAILRSQQSNGTLLGKALATVNQKMAYDRIIIITDEESQDDVGKPRDGSLAYMINVASTRNGVGYGKPWQHIDGFSENVLRWIAALEAEKIEIG